jgi:hypothetical protein
MATVVELEARLEALKAQRDSAVARVSYDGRAVPALLEPERRVAEARLLDLLLMPAAEQCGADEVADEPADLGRTKERADGSAGGGNCELGHGSVFRFSAVRRRRHPQEACPSRRH